jgi:hypothetical protein
MVYVGQKNKKTKNKGGEGREGREKENHIQLELLKIKKRSWKNLLPPPHENPNVLIGLVGGSRRNIG